MLHSNLQASLPMLYSCKYGQSLLCIIKRTKKKTLLQTSLSAAELSGNKLSLTYFYFFPNKGRHWWSGICSFWIAAHIGLQLLHWQQLCFWSTTKLIMNGSCLITVKFNAASCYSPPRCAGCSADSAATLRLCGMNRYKTAILCPAVTVCCMGEIPP